MNLLVASTADRRIASLTISLTGLAAVATEEVLLVEVVFKLALAECAAEDGRWCTETKEEEVSGRLRSGPREVGDEKPPPITTPLCLCC